MKKRLLFVPLLLVVGGCAGQSEVQADPDAWKHGEEFVLYDQVPAPEFSTASVNSPDIPPEVVEKYEILPGEDYVRRKLTRDELAEALRPLTRGPDGKTYIGRNRNYAMADQVLAMDETSEIVVDGEEPVDLAEAGAAKPQTIFGTDNRSVVGNTTPYKWIAQFSNGCSGVYIGWHLRDPLRKSENSDPARDFVERPRC